MKAGSKKSKKGQSVVEFSFIVIALMLLVMGTIELGGAASLSLRIASAVYEAGRIINTEALWPSASNTTAQNSTFLQSGLSSNIYPAVKNMILPADITNNGTVIFTYLTRVAKDTNAANDQLQLTYQWYFSGSSVSTSAPSSYVASKVPYSMVGSGTSAVKVVNSSFFDMNALLTSQSTVVVEIYHKTNPLMAKFTGILSQAQKTYSSNNTQVTSMNYIYDFAIY
ncbi:MAG: pilus assembly protein [Verrucomicrobiales bacterium]|jgi:Flp pilus assembly protein TadG|nr:pilus assembly protein [Verrucomicrobiales bacterium]